MATANTTRKDVLTRLDSLLLQNPKIEARDDDHDDATNDKQQPQTRSPIRTRTGILKSAQGSGRKRTERKRNIRFPDNEEMHEIIGYDGGEAGVSSDDDHHHDVSTSRAAAARLFSGGGSRRTTGNSSSSSDEETLSVEERNMINLTKKNTNFNARSQNLCSPKAAVRLGAEKKTGGGTPLVTIRPFVSDQSPGRVNKVSPMMHGQLVAKKVEPPTVMMTKVNPVPEQVTSFSSSLPTPMSELKSSSKGDKEVSDFDKMKDTKSESPRTVKKSQASSIAAARASFLSTCVDEGAAKPELSSSSSEQMQKEDSAGKIHVKLVRKSPYVTSSILKGTPKPVVVVKKPPLPKDKPKLPEKPLTISTSPKPAKRTSFKVRPAPSIPTDVVTVSDDSNIDLSSVAECYSTEADTQNEVIFEVNATRAKSPVKKEEALEEIRKSLTCKDDDDDLTMTRGNRPERSSTKRKAPKPPAPSVPTTSSPRTEVSEAAISYDKWLSKGGTQVVESSFTGQPIQMATGPAAGESLTRLNKAPLTFVSSSPIEDEDRKWKEKKRSKSVQPRGSAIDEIMGSSKAKPKANFLNTVAAAVNDPDQGSPAIRRQSRVELYESDRRNQQQQQKSKNKFFSKILKQFTQSAALAMGAGDSEGHLTSPKSFMDEEHEREILERERSKLRPSIIHPIDLNSQGTVEVIRIRPTATSAGHVFEKHRAMSAFKAGNKPTAVVTGASKSILKSKLDYMDSKDSGHETSSIHTDNSDASSDTQSRNNSSLESAHEQLTGFEQLVIKPPTIPAPTAAKLNGRLKPIPPPRSHSLEIYESSASSSASSSSSSSSSSNEDAPTPPEGYICAGKMNLGDVAVPAMNSLNLRRFDKTADSLDAWSHKALEDTEMRLRGGEGSDDNKTEEEDRANYRAVVSANLQVLTQLLSQASMAKGSAVREALQRRSGVLSLRDFDQVGQWQELGLLRVAEAQVHVKADQVEPVTLLAIDPDRHCRVLDGLEVSAQFPSSEVDRHDDNSLASSSLILVVNRCSLRRLHFDELDLDKDTSGAHLCLTLHQLLHLRNRGLSHVSFDDVLQHQGNGRLVVLQPTGKADTDTNNTLSLLALARGLCRSMLSRLSDHYKAVEGLLASESSDPRDLDRAFEMSQYLAWGPGPHQPQAHLEDWLNIKRAEVLNRILSTKGLINPNLSEAEVAELRFVVDTDADSLRRHLAQQRL